jgi:hypothetical protein
VHTRGVIAWERGHHEPPYLPRRPAPAAAIAPAPVGAPMSRQRHRSQAALGYQRFRGSDPVRVGQLAPGYEVDQLRLLERAVPPPQRAPVKSSSVPAPRGGNRLGPGHPCHGRPPSYPRCRTWGPDPERRDRNQRTRVRRAVALAQKQGSLSPTHAAVLFALLDASDDYLNEAWWRLSTIAKLVYGEGRYGDDPKAGQRTAGRWMAELRELGWVERVHRHRIARGQRLWTSNLWRFVIPEELREAVTASEDARRSRRLQKSPTPPPAAQTPPVDAPEVRAGAKEQPVPGEPAAGQASGHQEPTQASPKTDAAAEAAYEAVAQARALMEEQRRQAAAAQAAVAQAAQREVDERAALQAELRAREAALRSASLPAEETERSP